MNEMRRVETPEEIEANTRVMNELVRKDSFTIEKFYEVVGELDQKWQSIMRRLEQYENGDTDWDNTFPPVLRNMSVLGLELDRISTRTVLREGE
jgi:hypothetical protein